MFFGVFLGVGLWKFFKSDMGREDMFALSIFIFLSIAGFCLAA